MDIQKRIFDFEFLLHHCLCLECVKMCLKYREGGFYLTLSFWVLSMQSFVHKFGKLLNCLLEYALWDVTCDAVFLS
jgi:hypothetical protein